MWRVTRRVREHVRAAIAGGQSSTGRGLQNGRSTGRTYKGRRSRRVANAVRVRACVLAWVCLCVLNACDEVNASQTHRPFAVRRQPVRRSCAATLARACAAFVRRSTPGGVAANGTRAHSHSHSRTHALAHSRTRAHTHSRLLFNALQEGRHGAAHEKTPLDRTGAVRSSGANESS